MDLTPDTKYICPKCKNSELIPQNVIDYFDAIDPERAFFGPPAFRCLKCDYPYMLPEGDEANNYLFEP